MSACVSSHGEYSSHENDEFHTCKWCGAFDEAVVLKRLGAAEAERDEALARLAEAERAAAEKAWWEACLRIADGESNLDIADTYQKQNPYLEGIPNE